MTLRALHHVGDFRSDARALAIALLGVGALLLLYLADAEQPIPWLGCPLHNWTGLLCPGCGATRGLRYLLHGEIGAAFALNPLVIAALPLVGFVVGRELVASVRGKKSAPLVARPSVLWAFAAALFLFAVWRNL